MLIGGQILADNSTAFFFNKNEYKRYFGVHYGVDRFDVEGGKSFILKSLLISFYFYHIQITTSKNV